MSANDEYPQVEAKSSIKIGTNAKGDPVPDVKVYSGSTEAEMSELRQIAVAAYKATRVDLGFPA